MKKKLAWDAFVAGIKNDANEAIAYMTQVSTNSSNKAFIQPTIDALKNVSEPEYRHTYAAVKNVLRLSANETTPARMQLNVWFQNFKLQLEDKYHSHLTSQSQWSVLKIKHVPAQYDGSNAVNGYEILVANNDALLAKYPAMLTFGEDVGKIGGVNQTYAGLQQKYGELRVIDTGIREATIIGQGIGLALRGLRPIAEIQYLDYLVYALTTLTDDLACLHYRTKGGQKAPLIVSTRGHRLEGVWHAGSPMALLLGSLRGMHICVPRNMTQAAGFYNLLMQADDPALVIECLNGYRLKEDMPTNLAEFTVPLGVPETLQTGSDVTLVTYGSTIRVVQEAMLQLTQLDISCELIDVQTLLPFDINHAICQSIKKTNRVIFIDEDVNGGATAYMMQQVLEKQGAYLYLDSPPVTISAQNHRPAYGSDGDYFSKSNKEDIIDAVYKLMHEAMPEKYRNID
jgi:2-oxoisovalerate dehydrogenase E1 component